MLESLKEEVCHLNKQLLKNDLVKWTSGIVSARDPETGLIVIKPSGVLFEELTPEKLVVVNFEYEVIVGERKLSVDTASHLYVYKLSKDVTGTFHTQSPYATSFALRGEPLPIYTTTSAAVFGGEIPVSNFAYIGEEEIGREIVDHIGDSNAVLLRNHGVFTIGNTALNALKNAV